MLSYGCPHSPVQTRFFSSLKCPDWLWAHKSSYSMGTGGFFLPGVNQPGREQLLFFKFFNSQLFYYTFIQLKNFNGG